MITCKNCQAQLADGSLFCNICGASVVLEDETPLETLAAPEQPIPQPEPEQAPLPVLPITPDPVPTKKPKNKKLIALSIVFFFLVAVIVAGYLTNWFWGPLRGLFFVSRRTIRAKDMTVSVKVDSDSLSSDLIFLQYELDPKKEELTLLLDVPVSEDLTKQPTYVVIDDQTLYAGIAGEGVSHELTDKNMETIFLVYNMISGREKLDIEELLDELGLEDAIDAEELEAFLEMLFDDCLCDSVWLKTNMGFERDGSNYCFEIEPHRFYKAILEVAKESRLISSKEKRALIQVLEQAPNDTIDYKISTAKGYLEEIVIKSKDTKIIVEFSDINDTEVDRDKIEKLISKSGGSLCLPMDLYSTPIPAPDFYKRKAYTC